MPAEDVTESLNLVLMSYINYMFIVALIAYVHAVLFADQELFLVRKLFRSLFVQERSVS